MAQEYTLKLNIMADGSQAIAEAGRVRDAMDTGMTGGPQTAPQAAPQTNPVQDVSSALGEIKASVTSALGGIRTDVASALGGMRADIISALGNIVVHPQTAPQTAPQTTPQSGDPSRQNDASSVTESMGRIERAVVESLGRMESRMNPRNVAPSGASVRPPSQTPQLQPSASSTMFASVLGGVRTFTSAVSSAFRMVTGVAGGLFSALKGIAGFVSGVFSSAWNIPIRLLKSFALAAGSVTAAAYAMKKALDPAGKMQQFRQQLEVMTKSPRVASMRLRMLSKYAKDTNFSPDEVIGAGNRLQAFGMYSFKTLKLAGDAANAFGKSIDEVVQSLSYLNAGRGGEAMESLSRFGVTRDKLKAYGVKFGKGGELKTDSKTAVKAVLKYFEKEYGGMTKRVGKTWVGAMQQVSGEVFDALAKGFNGALKPATEFVTKRLIPTIGKIGTALSKVDWKKSLETPLRIASALLETLGNLMDPEKRDKGIEQMKGLWDGFKSVGEAFLTGLGGVFTGAVQSFGNTISNLLKTDAFANVVQSGIALFNIVLQGGIMMFKSILSGFNPELQMTIESILEKIPGINYRGGMKREVEDKTSNQLSELMAGGERNITGVPDATLKEMRRFVQDEYKKMRDLGEPIKGSYKDMYKIPGVRKKEIGELDADEMTFLMTKTSLGDAFQKRFGGDVMSAMQGRMEESRRNEIEGHKKKMNDAASALVGSISSAISQVAGAVDVSPLKASISSLCVDVGKSIQNSLNKSVSSILSDGMTPRTYEDVRMAYGREVANAWRGVRRDADERDREARNAHRARMEESDWSGEDAEWKEWNSRKARKRREEDVKRLQQKILDNARASLGESIKTSGNTKAMAASSAVTASNTGKKESRQAPPMMVNQVHNAMESKPKDDGRMDEIASAVEKISSQMAGMKVAIVNVGNLIKPISNAYAGA